MSELETRGWLMFPLRTVENKHLPDELCACGAHTRGLSSSDEQARADLGF
jgi:hypothetical protein